MVSFDDFAAAAPELAEPMRARFEAAGIAMLGTVRIDGAPRVSPVEVSLRHGGIYVGMMPGSMKARDLLRDQRYSLVTALADKDDLGGEGKLAGRARVLDATEASAYLTAAAAELGIDPGLFGDSHAFELLITEAAWQRVEGEDFITLSWRPGAPVRRRVRSGPAGDVHDA